MPEEINLQKIEVYRMARELCREGWNIYKKFDWQTNKVIGDQWIRAIDSCGANIAEAHGRFHYLDKIKFLYNARGSLYEALHWTDLLSERQLTPQNSLDQCYRLIHSIAPKLNSYIDSHYRQKTQWAEQHA